MERSNTVPGLQAKRAELVKLRKHLVGESKKVLCDIDHLAACIRLFDPNAALEGVGFNSYAAQHPAPKGHQKRFIFSALRKAAGPMTSRQITETWIKDRGLSPDESTFAILRKRNGECLKSFCNKEIVEGA
ncbi:MAG: hypothetical protein EP340_05200 [Alphaproteobacteria bacterium]|nr:MAG: hypothetical protein EP340_05200 [Alphaproteobacteria bacterium]